MLALYSGLAYTRVIVPGGELSPLAKASFNLPMRPPASQVLTAVTAMSARLPDRALAARVAEEMRVPPTRALERIPGLLNDTWAP
jgi:hypothetical protein